MPRQDAPASQRLPAAQRDRLDALAEEHPGVRMFTRKATGAAVIRQLTRYLASEDASKIRTALYDFLTLRCGFIAHFGLLPPDGNFQATYSEPTDLIEEMLGHHMHGGEIWLQRGEPGMVMADGMTDIEVYREVMGLALEARDRARDSAAKRSAARELATAKLLAERHGLLLVPNATAEASSQGRLFA